MIDEMYAYWKKISLELEKNQQLLLEVSQVQKEFYREILSDSDYDQCYSQLAL
jgi:hypothetical protein